MNPTRVLGRSATILLLSGVALGDVIHLRDSCGWHWSGASVSGWRLRRDWLTNPDARAAVTTDGKTACFRVDAANRGMKWSRSIAPVRIDDAPYLFVRYRAEDVRAEGDDYLIYVDDGVSGTECRPIRLRDAVADGTWRTVAVDLQAITSGTTVSAAAVQVQAGAAGQARLWVAELGLAESPPDGATLLRGSASSAPSADVAVDPSKATWTAQPSWLANPAARHSVSHAAPAGPTVFRVDDAGRGMKWHWPVGREIDLTAHRYLAMRYRADHLRGYSDYALGVLGKAAGGTDYEELIHGTDLHADGHWRTIIVPLARAASRIPKASGIAVQVQADRAPAELHVASLRLMARRPSDRLVDLLPFAGDAEFKGFSPVDLSASCNQSLPPVLRLLRLDGWPAQSTIAAYGIPFRLRRGERALAVTGVTAKTSLTIPIDRAARQVFVFVLAALRGPQHWVYGTQTFRRIDDVDRFRLRLTYDDGTIDECLPGNVSTGRFELIHGPQVLCAFADESRTLRSITLCDVTSQAAFAVAGVTCRTDGPPLHAQFDERRQSGPLTATGPPSTRPARNQASHLRQRFVQTRDELLRSLIGHLTTDSRRQLPDALRSVQPKETPDRPLLSITLDGKAIDRVQLRAIRTSLQGRLDGGGSLELESEVESQPWLRVRLRLEWREPGDVCLTGTLANRGDRTHRVGMVCPQVGPYRLGDDLDGNAYVFPCRAAVIGGENTSLSMRYGGMFGVQFMATVNPRADEGLHLRTEDTTCIERRYVLRKDAQGMFLAIDYPQRPLAPGQTRPLARTVVTVADGDWHRALDDYRRWVATWYRPASPRKPWFREVFNFRQRFLHWLDPLYDRKTGRIDLPRAVAEARERFGGIDYLHLFDWGNCGPHGRIYGRVGDYSPYDFIQGGRQALHDAIAAIRKGGVPVGLYIEGYLLDERGKLGREHGIDWQLRRPDGSGARWPRSREIFICPGVEAWRQVQSATYAAKVRELDVDGMYIDQFGFTGTDKDCYSDKHGHPVPSYPVLTERETTRAIRRAVDGVKPGVAIYTEESPCDVTSQYQDGSFTYEMNQCHARRATIPLNLFRFAVPDLKTFEILICDKPTASWATGVRWTFFNGEGIWLEGPADAWFTPETLAEIRTCHGILRRHRDAFTTDRPCPLVPTLAGCVFANHFPIEGKEVWTLYNARHRTVRGPLLRVAHRPGWRWHDAWHARSPDVRRDEPFDVITTDVGPHGVGCLVRTSPGTRGD